MPNATSTFRGRILNPETAVRFILAGDARVTFLNETTGNRFTYRVTAPKIDTARGGRVTDLTSPMRFVALADNEATFAYLGFVRDGGAFAWGRKSRVRSDAPSVEVFGFIWDTLRFGTMPDGVSIWHEGHCGRCGRTLTVPASIASGFGPDCAALLGIDQEAERVAVSAAVDPASLVTEQPALCCSDAIAGFDCACALDVPAVEHPETCECAVCSRDPLPIAGASDAADEAAERALAACYRQNHLINMSGVCTTCWLAGRETPEPTVPRVMCGCGRPVAMRCIICVGAGPTHRACMTCILTERHGATADCAWVTIR